MREKKSRKTEAKSIESASCYLVIDTRERAVFSRYMDILNDVPNEIRELASGDYMICGPNHQILTIFERKTHADMAATIKDKDRSSNKTKLAQARDQSNCRIAYILEGSPPARMDSTIGGIRYKAILSYISHAFQRDNVGVFCTLDAKATAEFLVEFVRSMNTLYLKPRRKKERDTAATIDNLEDPKTLNTRSLEGPVYEGGVDFSDQKTEILSIEKRMEWSDHVRKVWEEAVGSEGVTLACMACYSLMDFLDGNIDWDTLKYRNGRLVAKNYIEKLKRELANEFTLRKKHINMLGAVHNMSAKSAAFILMGRSLRELVTMDPEKMSGVEKSERGTTIGAETAKQIFDIFHFGPEKTEK